MTCITGVDKQGNPFIACMRGRREPVIREPLAIVPSSPWQPGRRVKHIKYGMGTITQRNLEAVSVAFDDPEAGRHPGCKPSEIKSFLLAYVGKTMEVVP